MQIVLNRASSRNFTIVEAYYTGDPRWLYTDLKAALRGPPHGGPDNGGRGLGTAISSRQEQKNRRAVRFQPAASARDRGRARRRSRGTARTRGWRCRRG